MLGCQLVTSENLTSYDSLRKPFVDHRYSTTPYPGSGESFYKSPATHSPIIRCISENENDSVACIYKISVVVRPGQSYAPSTPVINSRGLNLQPERRADFTA